MDSYVAWSSQDQLFEQLEGSMTPLISGMYGGMTPMFQQVMPEFDFEPVEQISMNKSVIPVEYPKPSARVESPPKKSFVPQKRPRNHQHHHMRAQKCPRTAYHHASHGNVRDRSFIKTLQSAGPVMETKIKEARSQANAARDAKREVEDKMRKLQLELQTATANESRQTARLDSLDTKYGMGLNAIAGAQEFMTDDDEEEDIDIQETEEQQALNKAGRQAAVKKGVADALDLLGLDESDLHKPAAPVFSVIGVSTGPIGNNNAVPALIDTCAAHSLIEGPMFREHAERSPGITVRSIECGYPEELKVPSRKKKEFSGVHISYTRGTDDSTIYRTCIFTFARKMPKRFAELLVDSIGASAESRKAVSLLMTKCYEVASKITTNTRSRPMVSLAYMFFLALSGLTEGQSNNLFNVCGIWGDFEGSVGGPTGVSILRATVEGGFGAKYRQQLNDASRVMRDLDSSSRASEAAQQRNDAAAVAQLHAMQLHAARRT